MTFVDFAPTDPDADEPAEDELWGGPCRAEGRCIGCGVAVDPPLQICSACAEYERTP